jgi:hypothetical protein
MLRVSPYVRDLLKINSLLDDIGEAHLYLSNQAVEEFVRNHIPEASAGKC